MWSRTTLGFEKRHGRWQIVHDHGSDPFDPESGAARLDLEPGVAAPGEPIATRPRSRQVWQVARARRRARHRRSPVDPYVDQWATSSSTRSAAIGSASADRQPHRSPVRCREFAAENETRVRELLQRSIGGGSVRETAGPPKVKWRRGGGPSTARSLVVGRAVATSPTAIGSTIAANVRGVPLPGVSTPSGAARRRGGVRVGAPPSSGREPDDLR